MSDLEQWVRRWRSTRANLLGLARTAYLNADPARAKRQAQTVLADIRKGRPAIDRCVPWAEL